MRIYNIEDMEKREAAELSTYRCWYKSSLILQIIYLVSMILWDWNSVFSTEIISIHPAFPTWVLVLIYVSHLLVIQFYFFKYDNIITIGSAYFLLSFIAVLIRARTITHGTDAVISFIAATNFILSVVLTLKFYQLKKSGDN